MWGSGRTAAVGCRGLGCTPCSVMGGFRSGFSLYRCKTPPKLDALIRAGSFTKQHRFEIQSWRTMKGMEVYGAQERAAGKHSLSSLISTPRVLESLHNLRPQRYLEIDGKRLSSLKRFQCDFRAAGAGAQGRDSPGALPTCVILSFYPDGKEFFW